MEDTTTITATTTKKPLNPKRFIKSQIPTSILNNPSLNASISQILPKNYNFELHKTIHRINTTPSTRPALQLPDGLLMYSLTLTDIIRDHSSTPIDDVLILADPTYGACCVDDFAASALDADLLVHYGHSCLVPVTESRIPVMYVFVEIRIDVGRLVEAIRAVFKENKGKKVAIAGTIQFVADVHAAKTILSQEGY